MNELISVIVPVYKVEEWLDECVESIVNQTYKNLEIILVDDGSPDNCPAMCDAWKERDARIKVIHKKNGGLSSARNAALEIITGKYISFVDSDDYMHPDMISSLYEDMQKTEADIVRCGRFTDIDGKIEETSAVKGRKIYSNDEVMECYFYHKDDFNSGVWDKLFRAELFEGVRFPDGINSEDYYIYAIVYGKCKKLYYNNKPLYYYRIRENSICSTPIINEHSFDKIKVSDMVYDYICANNLVYRKDAEAFQIIARFSIYYKTLQQEHTKEMEKQWIKDLKKHAIKLKNNKKLPTVFKLKYFILTNFTHIYILIKKLWKVCI